MSLGKRILRVLGGLLLILVIGYVFYVGGRV